MALSASARARQSARRQPRRCRSARHGAADHGACGQWPEIPSVETVRHVEVHEEELAFRDAPTAAPDRQGTADTVALQRLAVSHAIDGDGAVLAADFLSGKRRHALHQWDARAHIAALHQETGERRLLRDGQEVRDLEPARRLDGIEPNGRACGDVPHQLQRCRNEHSDCRAHDKEVGDHHVAEAGHSSHSRRFSHAAWRSTV